MARTFKLLLALIFAWGGITLALTGLALAGDTVPVTPGQTGPAARPHSPNSGVYTLYDSLTPADVPTATFNWVDISGSADFTWDLGGDFVEDADLSPTFPLGFIFPFYDEFYSEVRISEKGYLLFEQPGVNVGGGLPAEIPANALGAGDGANNFIAPFAGDLFGYPNVSRVYVRNDTAPRRTIIQFSNVVWCCGQNNPRTFQVILYPDGTIDYQYLKVANFPGALDQGQVVRVGLENLNGSAGDVYIQGPFTPNDPAFWRDGLAIRYDRSLPLVIPQFLPDLVRVWDDPDQPITVTTQLYLFAEASEARSFNIINQSLVVSSATPLADWENNLTFPATTPSINGTFSETLQFGVTVPTGADFSDIATATFVAESIEPPVVTGTFTIIYGPAHRDLQIAKTLDPNIAPAETGAFRYRLAITNTDYNNSNRPGLARGVVVTDVLPLGVVYEDCRRGQNYESCGGSVVTSAVGGQTQITWNIAELGVDQRRTIFLELRNTNPGGTPVDNTAFITLTGGIELGYPDRNSDSASFTVDSTDKIELRVVKDYPYPFNGRNYIGAGQVIPFDIFYYNDGRQGHIGNVPISATLVDTLPAGVTFDRATLTGDYNGPQITPVIGGPDNRTLTFNDLTADNGDWNERRIRLWVTVPQSTPVGSLLTNTVTLQGGGDSDSDEEVLEVASNFADPFVDKAPSRDDQGNLISPEPGLDYTYWITYGNRSVLTGAENFAITDTLPASVTLVSASPGQYLTGPFTSTAGGITTVSWFTDTLPRGATGQVLIIVRVDDNLPPGAPLVNQVSITYTNDFSPSNELDDTDVLTTETASQINASAKQVNNPTPAAGATVEYTIRVDNVGPATPFTVTDVLPPGLVFVSHDPPSTGVAAFNAGARTLSWTGGVVAENGQASLTFRAAITDTAQAGQAIPNTANISIPGVSINRTVNVTVAAVDDSPDGTIYLPVIFK